MNQLGILLAISVAGNAALGYACLGQRDKAVVSVEKTVQATGAAVACSAGTESLVKKADERKAAAAPKIEAAKLVAAAANAKGDSILATAATTPGNDCKSASDRVDAWWVDRGSR